jgi:hypothetical protein
MTLLYNVAHEHFNKTKKPPRSKHYTEVERPLRRVNENHIKLVKEPHSYVYRFLGHDAVRAYEPDENGNYQVCVMYDGYYSTDNYMGQFCGVYSNCAVETDDGRMVRLPLNHHYKQQDKDFTAVLMFNADGKLIVDQSWHADIYKKQSNQADKDTRKFIKQRIEALVTLQMFKMPSFKAGVKIDYRAGRPFGYNYLDINTQRTLITSLKTGEAVESEEFVTAFDTLSQHAFNNLVSKRIYDTYGSKGFFSSWNARSNPNHQAEIDALHKPVVENVSTDDLKTVLERKVLSLLNLNQGSDFVALPQFMESLPTKFYLQNK